MTMVIIDIEAYPSVLAGKKNGELPETILRHLVVPGQPEVVLIDPPMRGWKALRHYVALEGAILKTTGKYDSYRPLWVQTQIFFDRYQEEYTPWGSRTCSGKTWYKINRQVASAACPGHSNHGWAMAVDCNLDDPKVQPALEKWAVKCGFAWELLPEEPWHLHWYPGDKVPQAVLDYEKENDMSAEAENQIKQVYTATFFGGTSCGTAVPSTAAGQYPGNGKSNSIIAKLDFLIAGIQAGIPVDVDEAAIATEVAAQLAPMLQPTPLSVTLSGTATPS